MSAATDTLPRFYSGPSVPLISVASPRNVVLRAGFTLMELLVVVAIMGVVMTMAVPAIYRQLHPDSMQKAVSDIVEACSFARAQAILNDTPMEVRFRPFDRTINVGPSSHPSASSSLFSPSVSGDSWRMQSKTSPGAGGWSGRISDRIRIDMLDVNFIEYKDQESAQVRFYPNGTSDEFTIVLNNSNNEFRKITLEVVTGLADVQTDPNKVQRYLR